MSIQRILTTIIARILVKHKWQSDFLYELYELIFSIQERLAFENLARYSNFAESMFRCNYKMLSSSGDRFDWLDFNRQTFLLYGAADGIHLIIATIDCSFIPEEIKAAYGLIRPNARKLYTSILV